MFRESLQRFKMKFMPPSSRSFHERTDEVMNRLWVIESKLDQDLASLHAKVDSLSDKIVAFNEHSRLRWQELYREPGETSESVKRRFFKSIPPATGVMRTFQLANARLLHEFDEICKQLCIDYWVCFGSLVATVSRAGSIPWDDDIDICMVREDVARLQQALRDDDRFQLSLAYDAYVFCKQYRFSSKDSRIPCFIDVCIWDWASDCSKFHDDRLRQLRLSLMHEFESNVDLLQRWSQYPVLYAPDSGFSVQASGVNLQQPDSTTAMHIIEEVEAVFSKYDKISWEEGLFCEKDEADGLAYGLTNIYDAPWRRTIFPREMILPVCRLPYEGYFVEVPADFEAVCDECYPGWPYLPTDILGHDHLSRNLLEDEEIASALAQYAYSGTLGVRGGDAGE